jgi:superfamily I DNA/RNA helicase
MLKASTRQEKIFETWTDTKHNILINAVAGSGKTTTLLELLALCKHRTLFLAFNSSVQKEIQEKIENKGLEQGKSLTIHSLGLSSIRNWKQVVVNKGKNYDLVREFQNQNRKFFKYLSWEDKLRITYTLMDMNDISRLFLTGDYKQIVDYGVSIGKYLYTAPDMENLWEMFKELRDASYEGNKIVVDFNDMIYVPVRYDLEIPIYPTYLMVDEAQDLNLCQHALIDKIIAQPSLEKWIAVGDRNQSIYGFSGAYADSFNLFKGKDNVKECTLDICYRCDTGIIESANEVYDVMQAFSEKPGVVEEINNYNQIKDRSMVVCRNSAPIINLYFILFAQGKSCYIEGTDILNSVTRFLKPYDKLTIKSAKAKIEGKLFDLAIEGSERSKMLYHIFLENSINFKRLVQGFNLSDHELVSKLSILMKVIFKGKEDSIKLCTIHKAKGLEADVVYILNENLIPSKFATTPDQLQQEENLKYVARTRARHELYFLNV